MKCDGNHTNYKASVLLQRNFQVKFPDYMTFRPQRSGLFKKENSIRKEYKKLLKYSSTVV